MTTDASAGCGCVATRHTIRERGPRCQAREVRRGGCRLSCGLQGPNDCDTLLSLPGANELAVPLTRSAINMPRRVTTHLMFEGVAEEAMNLYVSVIPGSEIKKIERYGPGE